MSRSYNKEIKQNFSLRAKQSRELRLSRAAGLDIVRDEPLEQPARLFARQAQDGAVVEDRCGHGEDLRAAFTVQSQT